tara:strand:- start:339 stop:548 length:210 start_codon:yes stop_codon:yes gene_type:complete
MINSMTSYPTKYKLDEEELSGLIQGLIENNQYNDDEETEDFYDNIIYKLMLQWDHEYATTEKRYIRDNV